MSLPEHRVSVVIPAFNRAHFLGDCLRSVFAQSHPAAEVIVVDDGSTDNTREVIDDLLPKHPTLRYVHQENGGVSSARNLGMDVAAHSIIALLDSDDLWLPAHLEQAVQTMDAHPAVGMVFGRYRLDDPDRQVTPDEVAVMEEHQTTALDVCIRERHPSYHLLSARATRHRLINACIDCRTSSVVFDRGRISGRVGFDERLSFLEDFDFFIALLEKTDRAAFLREDQVIYVIHGDNTVEPGQSRRTVPVESRSFFKALRAREKLVCYLDTPALKAEWARAMGGHYYVAAQAFGDDDRHPEAQAYYHLSLRFAFAWRALKHVLAYRLLGTTGVATLKRRLRGG